MALTRVQSIAAMLRAALLFCAFAGAGAVTRESAFARALDTESVGSGSTKPTPVQRVIYLLNEMKAQLEKEKTEEAELYDKMVCWCETNNKEKTKAIADADLKITELLSEVEGSSAREGELATKIANLKEDLAEKKAALKTAVSIREKEAAAFRETETELVESITMVKNAVLVLGKHNAGLLQMSPAVQASLSSALRYVTLKHSEFMTMSLRKGTPMAAGAPSGPDPAAAAAALLQATANAGASTRASATDQVILKALRGGQKPVMDVLEPEDAARVMARALASATKPATAFAQQPIYASYSPQSSQIFGVLERLQKDFETNLSEEQKAELAAQASFEELKKASEEQIEAGTVLLDDLEGDYATTVKALSDAKEDLGLTRDQRSSDVKFLSDLRLNCQDLDHDYATRSKARNQELDAVYDTIKILTEDDNRELMLKVQGTGDGGAVSFLQARETRNTVLMLAARRHRAAAFLQAAAKRQAPMDGDTYKAWRSSEDKPHEQLAALAVQVQLDAFTKVKKAIDDMVEELKGQQKEEVEKKTFCVDELNVNEKQTYATTVEIADLKDKIEELTETIEKLTKAIAEAKETIANIEIELKKAGEQRQAENKAFQEQVMDQRTMQNILDKAIARLKVVYKKKAEALAQESNSAGQTPPEQFQPFSKNAGGTKVVGLIEQIVEDSKAVEKDLMAEEAASQQAYETFANDSTSMIKSLRESIEAKTKTKAATEVEKSDAESDLEATETKLEELETYAADMHAQCDFVLKNFDVRQKARLQEIEALQGAKALLSGMQDDDDLA